MPKSYCRIIETSIGSFNEEDFIRKCNEGSLPRNLYVTEDLKLTRRESLKSLPEGLDVNGMLDLSGCTSLTALPEGLRVRTSLYLWGCSKLESLPDNLVIGVSLLIQRCPSLTALPFGLRVEGTIFVDDSFIEDYSFRSLPKILHLPFTKRKKQILLDRLQR